jgi:hypothetical protein
MAVEYGGVTLGTLCKLLSGAKIVHGRVNSREYWHHALDGEHRQNSLDHRRGRHKNDGSTGLCDSAVRVKQRVEPCGIDAVESPEIENEILFASRRRAQVGAQQRDVGHAYLPAEREAHNVVYLPLAAYERVGRVIAEIVSH